MKCLNQGSPKKFSLRSLGCVDNWPERRRSAAEGPRNPGNGQIEIRILMH